MIISFQDESCRTQLNEFDGEENVDRNKKSQAYLLLAEAEEKLQKFGRAIKYYTIALEQLDPDHEEEYVSYFTK